MLKCAKCGSGNLQRWRNGAFIERYTVDEKGVQHAIAFEGILKVEGEEYWVCDECHEFPIELKVD